MKLVDRYGAEMMNVNSLTRKGDDLVMKGKMMGHISTSIYLKPEEVWSAVKLLSWPVIWYAPIMLVKGWKRSSGNNKKSAEKQSQ